MKKALVDKAELHSEEERLDILAHCLREIDLVATKGNDGYHHSRSSHPFDNIYVESSDRFSGWHCP